MTSTDEGKDKLQSRLKEVTSLESEAEPWSCGVTSATSRSEEDSVECQHKAALFVMAKKENILYVLSLPDLINVSFHSRPVVQCTTETLLFQIKLSSAFVDQFVVVVRSFRE